MTTRLTIAVQSGPNKVKLSQVLAEHPSAVAVLGYVVRAHEYFIEEYNDIPRQITIDINEVKEKEDAQ